VVILQGELLDLLEFSWFLEDAREDAVHPGGGQCLLLQLLLLQK
jgi:hypothetical protein